MALEPPRVAPTTFVESGGANGATPPAGPLVLIGPAPSGPINQLVPATSISIVTSTFSHGIMVEASAYALAYETNRVLCMRTDPTDEVDGSYGDIEETWEDADAPSVEADSIVLPGDDLPVVVTFLTNGILGATGIKYEYDIGGRKLIRNLGTDVSISLPNGAGKYNLLSVSSDADVIARVNEARTKFLAHIVNTTGTVHGVADTDSDDDVPSAAVTIGDAISLMAALLSSTTAEAHVVKLASVHALVDADALEALQAIPTPTNKAMTCIAFNLFKAAYNEHLLNQPDVHGAADVTNPITGADLVSGVVTAGDSFSVTNTGPRWHIDAIVAAIEVVRDTSLNFSIIEICGPVLTSAEALVINAALDDLRSKVKYRCAIGHWRMRVETETLVDYAEAFESEFENTSARRLAICPSFYAPSTTLRGATLPRPFSFHAAARAAMRGEEVNPIDGDGWGEVVGFIRDTSGDVLPRAVDEGYQAVLTSRRMWAPMTRPEYSGVRSSQGAMLSPDGSDYMTINRRRVADLAAEIAVYNAGRIIGKPLLPAPDGTIDRDQRQRIEGGVNEILKRRIVDKQKAVSCTFHLDPGAIITGNPPITVGAEIRLRYYGNIDAVEPLLLSVV